MALEVLGSRMIIWRALRTLASVARWKFGSRTFLSLGLNPYFTRASLGRKLSHESFSKFLEYKVRHFSVRDRDPLLIKQIGYAI